MSIFNIFKKKSTTTSTTVTPTSRDINVTDFSTGESVVKTTTTTGGGGGGDRSNIYKNVQVYSPQGTSVPREREIKLRAVAEQKPVQKQPTQEERYSAYEAQQAQARFQAELKNNPIQQAQYNQAVQNYNEYLKRNNPTYYNQINPQPQNMPQQADLSSLGIGTYSTNEQGQLTYTPQGSNQVLIIPPSTYVPSTTQTQITPIPTSYPSEQAAIGRGYIGPFLFKGVELQRIQGFLLRNSEKIAATGFGINILPSKANAFAIRSAAYLLPTTNLEVGLTAASIAVYPALPVALRIGGSAAIGYVGASGALNTNLSPEQRVASGVVGGLGTFGFVAESLPYLRGAYNVLSIKNFPYRSVTVSEQGFQEILLSNINEEVGLIPKGSPYKAGITTNVNLPKSSALVRGGFELPSREKALYYGQNKKLATSQIGFFSEGQNIKLTRELYLTPEEPFINIYQTRLSRLGLNEGFFTIPKTTEIGFGLPKPSQIGLTRGSVTPKNIGAGTELEVLQLGTISNVRRVGVSTIRGQGVDIYSFDLNAVNSLARKQLSSQTTTRISGESILSTSLGLRRRTRTTTKEITIRTLPTNIKTTGLTSIKIPTTIRTRTTKRTKQPSPPIIPTIEITQTKPQKSSTPIIIPKIPTSPPIYPPIKPQAFIFRRKPKITLGSSKIFKPTTSSIKLYVREKGRFKFRGTFPSLKRATERGVDITAKTINRSFKIVGANVGIPQGYRRSRAKGQKNVLVELSTTSLSQLGEQFSIQTARKRRKRR